MWRSSWWLRSCGMTTRSSSSSPSRLLRPAQTVHLKSTNDKNLTATFAAIKILGRRQPLVPLTSVSGNLCVTNVSTSEEEIVRSDSEREE
ncbi:hypothetical protein Taro_027553 [Colocasia esculenta]|uniref:Uncharacterized protein n=1 Tax=Colocasia esculenta TaxID=4460 RepID=A0A843VP38_COLES|nr:hypothetical protein [Colocasia esculenta]